MVVLTKYSMRFLAIPSPCSGPGGDILLSSGIEPCLQPLATVPALYLPCLLEP